LITAYAEGVAYTFTPGLQYSPSVFGGPGEVAWRGLRHGPEPLHFIGRLSNFHLPILARVEHYFDLPLLYGMRYSGCCLTYQVAPNSDSQLNLKALTPRRSSKDWPYEQYPPLLPYIPLRVGRRRRITYRAFARRYPNLADTQPATLVVVVPAMFNIGVSLWGRWGDGEGVTIVFECDVARRTVKAYNVCT
jgi:hypothetical protein